MSMFIVLIPLALIVSPWTASGFQKFDLSNLPIDLRPVQYLVGRWEMEQVVGEGQDNFLFGHILEFGIDPLPAFGARSLNYTAIVYDKSRKSDVWNDSRIEHYEYGYLPVKNFTASNPQVNCAFLTTGNEGYSMIEFGIVNNLVVQMFLNKFLARSFQMSVRGGQYQVFQLHREFRMGSRLEQFVNATTNWGRALFSVYYRQIFP
uniref:THAP4-like heme-binding beta-barrel domain-containing protein n=1 Tax=Romanomermis culicivorax TaxID=13658 RepID=A0A915LCE7_ROMCU